VWIVTGIIISGVVGLYLYDWYKNKKIESDDENESTTKPCNIER